MVCIYSVSTERNARQIHGLIKHLLGKPAERTEGGWGNTDKLITADLTDAEQAFLAKKLKRKLNSLGKLNGAWMY